MSADADLRAAARHLLTTATKNTPDLNSVALAKAWDRFALALDAAEDAAIAAEPKPITWPGAGDHEGHTITFVARWEPRVHNNMVTAGRVECSCGQRWDSGGWPPEVHDAVMAQPVQTVHFVDTRAGYVIACGLQRNGRDEYNNNPPLTTCAACRQTEAWKAATA